MKRMTVRCGGNVVTWAFNMDFLFCVSEEDYAGFKKLMEKLAAYEDAEEEGRLVVLPCKVGDEVYLNLDGQTHKVRVQGISIASNSTNCIIHFGGYPVLNLWGSEFGKTAFLTKEEAEAALGKMEV